MTDVQLSKDTEEKLFMVYYKLKQEGGMKHAIIS